jgi:hypothetical protein
MGNVTSTKGGFAKNGNRDEAHLLSFKNKDRVPGFPARDRSIRIDAV